jgi:hypothetical protein
MTIFKKLMMAGTTLVAGYAMKKMMKTIESHGEKIRQQAENSRDPGEFKRLKQDPATGIYYAED